MINGEVGPVYQAIEFNDAPEISNRVMQMNQYLADADRLDQQAKMQKELNQINDSERLSLEAKRRKITARLMAISLRSCGLKFDLDLTSENKDDQGRSDELLDIAN